MNVCHFIGRVGGDAELHYTQSGKAVASFSMAIDNGKDSNGQKRNPTWIKATLWEKRAESLQQYITKGKLVAVTGPVSTEAWISKQDGSAQAKIVVTVRDFEFCGGPKDSADGAQPGGEDNGSQAPAVQPGSPITDEDIPF